MSYAYIIRESYSGYPWTITLQWLGIIRRKEWVLGLDADYFKPGDLVSTGNRSYKVVA